MKRIILTLMFAMATLGFASAQKYCVIDSEKLFKSLDEYNKAMTTLDELGKAYQTEVDNKYKSIEFKNPVGWVDTGKILFKNIPDKKLADPIKARDLLKGQTGNWLKF